MTTLPPMRLLLRQAAIFSSAVALVFFCSCERHRATELPHHEHPKPGGAGAHGQDDGHGHGSAKAAAGDAHQHDSHAPAKAGTPAQFFPSASPSPR